MISPFHFGKHSVAMAILFIIIFAVILNTAAQLLLKAGMDRVGHFAFSWANVVPVFTKTAFNPFILAGLCIYVASFGAWLLVLSRADVSYAYPMTSLGYIFSAVAAYYWLGEHVSLERVVGILIIIAGVYLISRS